MDFPELTSELGKKLGSFHRDVMAAVKGGTLMVSVFEKALLGFKDGLPDRDLGLVFHHGRRFNIWYGSPMLYQRALNL